MHQTMRRAMHPTVGEPGFGCLFFFVISSWYFFGFFGFPRILGWLGFLAMGRCHCGMNVSGSSSVECAEGTVARLRLLGLRLGAEMRK